jgi:hypothetical protein
METMTSEMDTRMEPMAKKVGEINGINAQMDELSKGEKGENGVSLKSPQYIIQKQFDKLEKTVKRD